MAARVSAIGGGAKFKAEMMGLKETRLMLRDLMQGIANESDLSTGEKAAVIVRAKQLLQAELGEAAAIIRDTARSNAAAENWPAAVVKAIFKFSDLKESERKRQRGALAGVRTGAPRLGKQPDLRSGPRMGRRVNKAGLYIEWRAGYNQGPVNRRSSRKGTTGRLMGMSLGRVMETGTQHNQATRAFRRAVIAKRGEVLRRATEGYQMVVRWIAARHGKAAA